MTNIWEAVLYYQSIPPYYLSKRFTTGTGPETKRLAYITSHMTLEGTPLENRKHPSSASRAIGDASSSVCRP